MPENTIYKPFDILSDLYFFLKKPLQWNKTQTMIVVAGKKSNHYCILVIISTLAVPFLSIFLSTWRILTNSPLLKELDPMTQLLKRIAILILIPL